MIKKVLLIGLILSLSTNFYAQNISQNVNWNAEKEKQHLLNREDSSKWDYALLERDIEQSKKQVMRPFQFGAFPVGQYNLLGEGAFTGLGFASGYKEIDNSENHLIYSSFFVNKNKFTERYLPDNKSNEVFFLIIVLSDVTVDTIDYSHLENHIISRNNPDYIGQGFVKTSDDEIDYMAFLTADRNEYAIVNMRLFSLKNGRIILIAPQKNGSLKSMQLKSEYVLSSEDIEDYIDSILKEESVKFFFENDENIGANGGK